MRSPVAFPQLRKTLNPPQGLLWLGMAVGLLTMPFSEIRAQDRADYLDETKPIEARVQDLLSRLTVEEEVSMVHAKSTFAVPGVPRLGIPDLWMDDGPMGVREEVGEGFRNMARTDDAATALPATLGLDAEITGSLSLARELALREIRL